MSILGKCKRTILTVARIIVPPRLRPGFDPVRKLLRRVLIMLVPSMREQRKLDRMIGPLGHWEEIKRYQISLLKKMGLQPHHTLLDIGCGPLSGGLAFIPYLDPGNYFGVDLRETAIDEAKIQVKKAGLAGKRPVLVVSDSFGAGELDGTRFDFIWASQITYHLNERLLESCLEWAAACLKPEGRFLADFISIPALVTPDKRWYEYSFHFHTLEAIGELCDRHGLTYSNLGAIKNFGYPVDWDFKHNYLLEFRRVSEQKECLQ